MKYEACEISIETKIFILYYPAYRYQKRRKEDNGDLDLVNYLRRVLVRREILTNFPRCGVQDLICSSYFYWFPTLGNLNWSTLHGLG